MPLFYIGDRSGNGMRNLQSPTEEKVPSRTKTKSEMKPVVAVIAWFRKWDSAYWTAFATVIMAIFTVVLARVSYLQWRELHKQGYDTEKLAIAAVATSRAWIAPEQMTLGSPVESGLPLRYAVRVMNDGKEPALGVVWQVRAFGVPYIREDNKPGGSGMGLNRTCTDLKTQPENGLVIYPSAEGVPNYWIPMSIPDTAQNRLLLEDVRTKAESLVIEGCFAYHAASQAHTSSFRFFLRDIPSSPSFIAGKDGKPAAAWGFNAVLTGNEAN